MYSDGLSRGCHERKQRLTFQQPTWMTTTPIVEVTVTDHGINPLQDYSHIQLSCKPKLATVKAKKADVFSISHSSE